MSKMTQDAKKDEFRRYLEKAGVLELLTKSLVQLYEEPDKPHDALSYLKNSVGGSPDDKTVIAKLKEENEALKQKCKEMEAEKSKLENRVKELENGGGKESSDNAEEAVAKPAPAAAEVTNEPTTAVDEAVEVAATKQTEETPSAPGEATEAAAAAKTDASEPMETEAPVTEKPVSEEATAEASPTKPAEPAEAPAAEAPPATE